MKIIPLLTISALTVILMGCSAHPGAGNWQTTTEENPDFIREFVRLGVSYEGRTNIFADKSSDSTESNPAIRRCFWHGIDAQTITMTCVQAANTDIEESYQLHVGTDRDIAELIKDERIVGRFIREERPEVEHSYKEILQPR